jgi:hypothetical protein
MKTLLRLLMASNAALFFFGALQHAGIAIGSLHEPRIIPAAAVETMCGLFLAVGAVVVFNQSEGWIVWTANMFAISGVLLGMAALAMGRGPRTATNDLYHRIMLILAGASLVLLLLGKTALRRSHS